VARSYGLAHISTGDVLREAVDGGTPVGLRARSHMEAGDLVPDDIVVAVLVERIRDEAGAPGVVLDGFPRDLPQAEAAGAVVGRPDAVLHLDVPDEEVIRRIAGRRRCSCGRIYHVQDRPPRVAETCDVDGRPLVARADDRPEVVAARLAVYRERTEPVIRHYMAEGLVVEIDGRGDVEEVTRRTLGAIEQVPSLGRAAR
jgi:adenylate kinase